MLQFIFYTCFFMSIAFILSGSLVMLCEKLFSGVLSKRALYVLYIVPLVLSLVPLAPPSPSASHILSSEYEVLPAENAQTPGEINAVGNARAEDEEKSEKSPSRFIAQMAPLKERAEVAAGVDISKLPPLLWLSGVIFLALSRLLHALRFRRGFLRFAEVSGENAPEYLASRAGVKRNIPIYSFDFDASPFVYGVFRPKIAVPRGETAPEALLHELIHIKRRDLIILDLIGIVKILHFFNPFAYIYSERVKRIMELSCDERASSLMDLSERAAYSKSLILCSAPLSGSAACLSENGKYLKERIELVMKNKKRGALSKALSLVIAAFVILGQTALASAVNELSPAKDYGAASASFIGSALLYDYDSSYASVSASATLVITPLEKSFSADVTMKGDDKESGEVIVADDGENGGEDSYEPHLVHVKMDSLTKTFASGRNWKGKFTVTLDGNVIMDGADGVLHSLPGGYPSDTAALLVKDGERSLWISDMNFSLKSDSVINWEAENERYYSFTPTFSHTLTDGEKIIAAISANETEGKLKLELDWDDLSVSSVPGEKYEFENGAASGRFYLRDSYVITDEFYGTLTYSETSLSLKSDDGNIDISYENLRADEDSYIKISDSVTLSDLPFTLTLAPDKKSITLKIRDSVKDSWFYTYSSYVRAPYNVFSDYVSERGARETRLPLSEAEGGVHNLQFTLYRTEPSLYSEYYDIMLRIIDGEIFYTGCHKRAEEDASLSGAAAVDYMEHNSMLSAAKRYYYDENGVFKYTVE